MIETKKDLLPLRANPILAQMKQHSEKVNSYKAISCLQDGILDVIFTKIIAYDTC